MYPYNLKLLLGVSKKQKNRENQKKKITEKTEP
jgi:hypothetical protein